MQYLDNLLLLHIKLLSSKNIGIIPRMIHGTFIESQVNWVCPYSATQLMQIWTEILLTQTDHYQIHS